MKNSHIEPFKTAPREAANMTGHTLIFGSTRDGMTRSLAHLMTDQIAAGGKIVVLDKGSTSEHMIEKIKSKALAQ